MRLPPTTKANITLPLFRKEWVGRVPATFLLYMMSAHAKSTLAFHRRFYLMSHNFKKKEK